jgi:hypothetical protein
MPRLVSELHHPAVSAQAGGGGLEVGDEPQRGGSLIAVAKAEELGHVGARMTKGPAGKLDAAALRRHGRQGRERRVPRVTPPLDVEGTSVEAMQAIHVQGPRGIGVQHHQGQSLP